MGKIKMNSDWLYEQNIDEILSPTMDYTMKLHIFADLKEDFEKKLNLTDADIEILDEVFDAAFALEDTMHKQVFMIGFKMAKDLLLS